MTQEQREIVVTTAGLMGAFLLAIMAVCWAVAEIAASLAAWAGTR